MIRPPGQLVVCFEVFMAKRPSNDGASWNAAELKRLQSLAKKGLSAAASAQELGRTPAAVQQKAMREGISFRAIKRTSGAAKKKTVGKGRGAKGQSSVASAVSSAPSARRGRPPGKKK